ncbi:IS5 family transposase [Rhizobium leguminosarum]|uniref:IS5 family transposase n=1 Tax=Rhizobium leguminosarum TaxID=384 RepID=UPI00144129CA|nr:IS5 family transposase [Rhizobium leguminosarum bv. viciae]
MGVKRYELNEAQWSRIAPLLPDKSSDPGRTEVDNRTFVNGCLWILRSGAHWQDLPERYGKWKTVHRRFSRWCQAGVWEQAFDALSADRDNRYLMIDSTIVRAINRLRAEKRGQGSGAGAFQRWTEGQGSYAGRCIASSRSRNRETVSRPAGHLSAKPCRPPEKSPRKCQACLRTSLSYVSGLYTRGRWDATWVPHGVSTLVHMIDRCVDPRYPFPSWSTSGANP